MRKAVILGAVAALGMSTAFAGESVSYSYVDAGYGYGELASGEVHGDGFKLAASLELPANFIVVANYRDFTFDDSGSNLDISELGAGLAYKCALGEMFDILTGVSYQRLEIEGTSETGFGLSLGTRGRVTDNVEVSVGLEYADIKNIPSTFTLSAGVRRYFTPAFSAGLDVRKSEFGGFVGETSFIAGVRYDFGSLFN